MTLMQRITDYPKLQQENSRLHQETTRNARNYELLQERLAELEFAIEDQGWTRLGHQFEREFSRDGLNKLARMSRIMYLWNPLIRRAVNLRGYYTWGQGVEVNSDDDKLNEIIQQHMDDEANSEDLYSDVARLETDEELHNTGNIFSILFTRPNNGKVDIRSIPSEQIVNIITNPDDQKDVWYYERQWYSKDKYRNELYPDVLYKPRAKPSTVDNKPVNWDAPIAHLRAGGQKFMLFGVPETYPALDWARSHKQFLEDWVSLVKSLMMFSWQVTSQNPEVDKSTFESTFARPGENTNPQPIAGSMWFGDEASKITAIPKSGATVNASDSRELRLMIASAMDLPDTFLSGDVDVGNFATSRTLDRPTEMMVKFRQKRWASYWRKILRYVVEQQVRRNKFPGRIVTQGDREYVTIGVNDEFTVNVRFPDILEHDPNARINAIVSAATLGGSANTGIIPDKILIRELLIAIGVEDVDELVDDIMSRSETNENAESSRRLAEAINKLRESVQNG